MYQETLALSDNPFGPRADSIAPPPRDYLKDLDRAPLRPDKRPELLPLFSEAAYEASKHLDEFRTVLFERGYSIDPPRRGDDSLIVLIRGDRGAGKTSLACRMIVEVLKTSKAGDNPWKRFELHAKEERQPVPDRAEYKAALAELDSQILENSAHDDYVCALVEDVTQDNFDQVADLYGKYQQTRTLIFFAITHDILLQARDFRSYPRRVQVFSLSPLLPEQADSYVSQRLEYFRDPKRAEIREISQLFPFCPDFIRRQFSEPNSNTVHTTQNSITLRVLNTNLRASLHSQHLALKAGNVPPVANAPASQLSKYLIGGCSV
jgi:hypothetical protein